MPSRRGFLITAGAGLLASAPNTPIHGSATTMMGTFDVLPRAANAGLNFEPLRSPQA